MEKKKWNDLKQFLLINIIQIAIEFDYNTSNLSNFRYLNDSNDIFPLVV